MLPLAALALAAACLQPTDPAATYFKKLQQKQQQQHVAQPNPADLFLQAWQITRTAFYDPGMHGIDWEAVRDELLPRAAAAATPAELSTVINDALSRLHASHTTHYTPDQREYYEILDIFWPDGIPQGHWSLPPGPVEYVGIGLASTVIDGRTFAKDVYESGPAAKAGILVGDELLSVEGAPWSDIAPFRDRAGRETKVQIRRAAGQAPRTLTVTPATIRPRELFLESMDAGARIIRARGHSIAYIRIRSYANPAYHEKLKDHLSGQFADVDAIILDLRGGWGGASPEYMDIFNPVAPAMIQTERDGKQRTYDPTWRKPTAILIDSGTRSGKEMLAHAIRKHHLATLVGDTTAGAVLGGTVRELSDGSILFLAVADVTIDGDRLEGIGVEPDLKVPRPIPYCAGADPQGKAAVLSLIEQLQSR